MIEKSGVFIHLDPKDDRVEGDDLEFTGWVAAEREVKAIWLPEAGRKYLTTRDRPDVQRVFPNHVTLGFSGKSKELDIGPKSLRIAVQVGEETVEVEHPLPAPIPKLPTRARVVIALQLVSLGWHAWLTTNSSKRWALTLRRHLL